MSGGLRRGLVLGGSSGIGAAVAARLAAEGAVVHVGSRSGRAQTGNVVPVEVDVRDYASVVDALRTAAGSSGALDFVVNSAGVGFYAPLDGDFSAAWREIVETNVLGAVHVCSAVVAGSPEVARLVHIGSLAAVRPSRTAGNGVYSAAKAAAAVVVEQTRSLLRERGSLTHVTAVVPGFVDDTRFGERFFTYAPGEARPLYGSDGSLAAADVASVVLDVLHSPAHVELTTVVVRPTLQPD